MLFCFQEHTSRAVENLLYFYSVSTESNLAAEESIIKPAPEKKIIKTVNPGHSESIVPAALGEPKMVINATPEWGVKSTP